MCTFVVEPDEGGSSASTFSAGTVPPHLSFSERRNSQTSRVNWTEIKIKLSSEK